MSFTDSIKDTYYSLEDKWYSFVDKVSEKLPVFGKAVDFIEEKNIPSFPAAIILIVLIILLLFFLLTSSTTSVLTVGVVDSSELVLSGVNVSVYSGLNLVANSDTNSDGIAVFKLPPGKYNLRLEKSGYTTLTKEVEAGKTERITLIGGALSTKTVYMKTSDGRLITGSGTVKYYCVGSDIEKSAFYKDGKFDVDFGNECTEITIQSISGYKVISGQASFSGGDITVEETPTNTGSVRVNLLSNETIPPGLKVVLSGEDGVPQQVKVTETSVVVFENVPTKKYYVTVYDPRIDVETKFETWDGKKLGETKEVTTGNTTEFTVSLTKTASKKIVVTVRDVDTALVIKGAEVGLNLISNSTRVETKITGLTGQVTFDIAENEAYNISADHPEYIVGTTKTVTSEQTEISIDLVKANSENSQSIKVNVIDNDGKIIENARVVLKKLDNTEIDEKTTGSEGTAEFYNLEINQNYYVYVAKEEYSANSTSVTVTPRRQTVIDVKLNIGKGKITILVLDSEKSPLKGASVKMNNYYSQGTQTIEEQKNTDSEGKTTFEVRADKLVYFVIEGSGFSKYTTTTIKPDADSIIEKEVTLQKATGKVEVQISMNTKGGSLTENAAERTVSAGVYTAKVTITIPKGTYSEAGIHLRTGKATEGMTNLMEEDSIKITEIRSAASRTTKGTSYTPNNGYDKDSKNLTTGDSKWVNALWRNPSEGTYELEADILITEISQLQGINVWYRGWAKGASTLRDPASNTTGINELYSTAKNYILTGGSTNICANGFCKTNTIEVLSGTDSGKRYYINNTFTAKKDVSYLLITELTNNSGRSINGAVLSLESVGIDLNLITINGVEHSTKTIDLGTIGVDSYNRIAVVFTPRMSGTNTITTKIDSSTKNEFEQTTTITVKANKKFSLDIIPKEIIPYIKNNMFFEVIDGNTPLSGVLIEIKKGVNILGTVETSGEGLATYELASPSIGDVITITATKEGYDTIEITKEAKKSILLITPPSISETIKIGEIASISQTILMQNTTVKDVKIKSTSFSGDLSTYLDLKFNETITGALIEKSKDKNYTLTIKPNSISKKLKEPLTLNGNLIITTEIEGTTQNYENEIPITIRLSMPGYIDSEKCLKVTPGTIEFIAAGSEATQTIELENTCTAEGIQINLHDIEAKINETSKLGSVLVSGNGFSGGLSTAYTKIGTILEKGTKETLTVRFVPNGSISSGTQDLKITFKGSNIPEENEVETIEASTTAKITMSNLSKCITIEEPSGGITLDVAPWNMGYSRLMTSNISSYAQNYEGFSNRNQSYPYGMTSAIPFMNSSNSGSAGQQQNYNTYEQSSFTIQNNCAIDIEIDLDADSRIGVSEEKFTIGSDSEQTINVNAGYTLGKYKIKVYAKPENTEDTKKKIDEVSVIVRKLGDIDNDCIKLSTSIISLNSFIYTPKQYKVYNYCYDSGVTLPRSNNTVSIQCDGPLAATGTMGQTNSTLFQQGYENMYSSQYPLNSTYNTYYDYAQSQTCGGNNCSVITGTRVTGYNLTENSSGSVEEIKFEVMPNASYIPQSKLFNSNSGQYGLFQTLGDFRQWATETDSRSNIYGNVNVQYNNQYGQTQCMTFPVDIEDDWRALESIDSAINWGDGSARPEECVSEEESSKSLDIYGYWLERGNTKGAVPEIEYKSGNYIYYPKIPAVKIGPAPTMGMSQTYYPNMQYFNNYQGQNNQQINNQSMSSAKNCGLLDKLSNITYQNEFEGAIISVESVRKGSLINNTLGPNLVVSINRNGLRTNCVFIETTVTSKLTRAVNFQSGEVTWKLRALITAPNYTIKSNVGNIEELKQECTVIGDPTDINNQQSSGEIAKGCSTSPEKYGFNLIGKTNAEEISNDEYANYCTEKFCNNDMLQIFIRNRMEKIIGKINQSTLGCSDGKTVMLSELYKTAEKTTIQSCEKVDNNYYLGENGKIIEETYIMPKEILEEYKTKIENIKKGVSSSDSSLIEMSEILDKLESKEKTELLLKIKNDTLPSGVTEEYLLNDLGIKKINSYYYVPIKYLSSLNTGINENFSDCNTNGKECTINLCSKEVKIKPETMKWVYDNSLGIVKVINTTNPDKNEIEKIYTNNNRLNEAHKLALFSTTTKETKNNSEVSNDLLLTQINSSEKLKTELNGKVPSGFGEENYTIKYTNTITPGKYEGEIDTDLCKTSTPKEITLKLVEKTIKEAPEVKKNVVLQSGFKVTIETQSLTDSSQGIILRKYGEETKLFSRIPIKLTMTLNPQETELRYAPTSTSLKSTTGNSIITWNEFGNKRPDQKTPTGIYAYKLEPRQETREITGIYYYPNDGSLVFYSGTGGGRYTMKTIEITGVTPKTESGELPAPRSNSTKTIQTPYNNALTLDNIIELIRAENGKLCINTDGQAIIWNETKLLAE
ncbi:MAG TPA: carboxypeptidase-like regulatory domain-containing protein [archaeon]|nr:carboxypeptidase-like regulatory domain-containing protein [archaeon]